MSCIGINCPCGARIIGLMIYNRSVNCFSLNYIVDGCVSPFRTRVEDLSYSIKYDSVIITDCKTTASGALEIPSTISGYPVTRIENAAFRSCSNLTRVSLPDGVVSIGEESFYSCSNLAEIIIPNSVSSIGESAFRYCSSLVSINLPEGLTTINESTFHGCSNLNR